MARFDIDEKIRLVRPLAGRTFRTERGLQFTYEVSRDTVYTSRTDYALPLSDSREALALVSLPVRQGTQSGSLPLPSKNGTKLSLSRSGVRSSMPTFSSIPFAVISQENRTPKKPDRSKHQRHR